MFPSVVFSFTRLYSSVESIVFLLFGFPFSLQFVRLQGGVTRFVYTSHNSIFSLKYILSCWRYKVRRRDIILFSDAIQMWIRIVLTRILEYLDLPLASLHKNGVLLFIQRITKLTVTHNNTIHIINSTFIQHSQYVSAKCGNLQDNTNT